MVVFLLQYGMTSMHKAAKKDNLSLVKYLVESFGDVNAKDNVGSPLFPIIVALLYCC